jgi:LacI family transcriptional regulator
MTEAGDSSAARRGTASRRAPRLQDVAALAGVHVSTVSRVLNGAPIRIGQDARDRVVEAARKLNYRPNASARGLKLAATGALGLLVPSLRTPVYAEIIHGAMAKAADRGFVVLMAEDAGEEAAPQAYSSLLQEGRIDGLLVASARAGGSILQRNPADQLPTVFLNRRMLGTRRNVSMREEDAGHLAAQRFLAEGHRELAQIAGESALDTARRRLAGFVDGAAEAGIEPTIVQAAYDEGDAKKAMRILLERSPRPTAVFISNLNQTIGAVSALGELGVEVPAEMSLIACDDDPIIDFLAIPVTTIRMPLAELGSAAVDLLLRQIEGRETWDYVVPSPPRLIDRGSVAAPPS